MPKTDKPTTQEQIRRERELLKLAPWEFSPTEVQDFPCPYPPSTIGYRSWQKAAEQWREMQAARRSKKHERKTAKAH
jgi:hypothetical protein